jgi:hypothetical protein
MLHLTVLLRAETKSGFAFAGRLVLRLALHKPRGR